MVLQQQNKNDPGRNPPMPHPWLHDSPVGANLGRNAHAQFARMVAADASRNTTGTNTPEETQPSLPAAAAAGYTALPPDATEAEISDTVSSWFSSHHMRVIDKLVQCLDPDQTVPQHVQDWTDYA